MIQIVLKEITTGSVYSLTSLVIAATVAASVRNIVK